MSFHPQKGQDVEGRESAGGRVQDMGRPVVVGTKGRSPALAAGCVPVLKGARCPSIGACRSVDSRILFERNTVL